MRIGWVAGALLIVGLSVGPAPAWSNEADAAKVRYLKEHTLRVRGHDPADTDFADLEPLKTLWKDVRIVQLGEQTHGDGACFLAKTRLIRFLHQEMGFDVLAFESGLYDCAKAWEAFQAPPGGRFDAVEAMSQGVFGIWMQSHEVKPLAGYLHKVAHNPKPLELCGFDCQLTGTASRHTLARDLAEVMGKAIPTTARVDHAEKLQRMVEFLRNPKATLPPKERNARLADLENLATAMHAKQPIQGMDLRTRAWWAQVARSLGAQLRNEVARRESTKTDTWGPVNRRDAQMAENLIWLADEHYKGRKIIVWAATFHIIRNAPKLVPVKGKPIYTNVTPMGHAVAKHFGDACYTLGFTAYEGEVGRPWTDPSPLPPAPKGTFEDWMQRTGVREGVVDLKAPAEGGAWLHQPFVARPLGNAPMRGSGWHDAIDGLYFQRTMTPSTRNGYTPPAKVDDMRPLLDKQWNAIRSGLARGNMWAEKWTFAAQLKEWMRGAKPTAPAEIEAQEQVVRAWLAEQQEGEDAQGLPWRVHFLLADMAAERKDVKAERAALETALGLFPEKDLRQPAKVSQFQHIANRLAWVRMQGTSFAKAKAWFTGTLAKDRRFRYAYLGAWDGHIDAKQRKDLVNAVRKAYAKRAKRFRDLADEIERFQAELP